MAKSRPPARLYTDDERRARVEELITAWQTRLGLNDWMISYQFVNKSAPSKPTTPDSAVFATITTNAPYRRASIEYVRSSLDASTDEEVLVSTVHELIHLFLVPVADRVRDLTGDSWLSSELMQAVETVCDSLALRFVALDRYQLMVVPHYDPLDIRGRPT